MLPDGSGIELCSELRASRVDVPILLLTAKGEVRSRVLGLEAGADDYLSTVCDFRVARTSQSARATRSAPAQAQHRNRRAQGRGRVAHGAARWGRCSVDCQGARHREFARVSPGASRLARRIFPDCLGRSQRLCSREPGRSRQPGCGGVPRSTFPGRQRGATPPRRPNIANRLARWRRPRHEELHERVRGVLRAAGRPGVCELAIGCIRNRAARHQRRTRGGGGELPKRGGCAVEYR
jgi:CheY-like chemotaxis protein